MVVTFGATTVASGPRMFSGEVARQRRPRPHVLRSEGTPLSVIAFTVAVGRITGIHMAVDPAKLASIDLPATA
ncbi:hypothetical protein ACIA8R_52845 [Nonomuraea sp. NPDC051191]|uniref:hypothetical protein n=1 Tax=Nonomuraea sp. NPDC051191 TaxID=3364372 RepID=UPI0037A1CD5D